MSRTLQFKRYANTVVATTTGADGELIIDETNHIITVHDGVTAGGIRLASENYVSNIANTDIATAVTPILVPTVANVTVLQGNVITLTANVNTHSANIATNTLAIAGLQANVAGSGAYGGGLSFSNTVLAYTLTGSEVGKDVVFSNTCNITIPVGLPPNFSANFLTNVNQQLFFYANTGVILNNAYGRYKSSGAAYDVCCLDSIGANTYNLYGSTGV